MFNKYKDIKLIENPYYEPSNNMDSLYVARAYLGNCIILDGNQIIYNREILNPVFEKSGYCSMWTEEETQEWLQYVKDNKVISCSRSGGKGDVIGIDRYEELVKLDEAYAKK